MDDERSRRWTTPATPSSMLAWQPSHHLRGRPTHVNLLQMTLRLLPNLSNKTIRGRRSRVPSRWRSPVTPGLLSMRLTRIALA